MLLLLLRTIDGFVAGNPRRKSADEEIDIVVRNESRDAFWSKESPYLLVECKNWSKPADRLEFDALQAKLTRRYGRAKLGFLVAAGGFTSGFKNAHLAARKDDVLVVGIGPEALAELVGSTDRNQTLKELHDRALVEGNGA